MTAAASWITMTLILGAATIIGCALRLAGLAAEAESKLVRTLRFKHCTTCHHEFEHYVTDYDPDLGETHVIETTCLACEYDAGRHIDIDLDSTSIEEIQSIGREQKFDAMSA